MSTETPRGRTDRIVPLAAPRSAPPPPPQPGPAFSEAPTEALPAAGRPVVPADPAPAASASGGAEVPEKPARRNGMGTPALVLGVLAAGTCYAIGWSGVVLGLFAVVTGYLGARRAFHNLATDGGLSLGGLVLGGIGLVVGAIVVWPTVFGSGNFGDGLTLDQCMAQSTSAKDMHMCKSQHITEFSQRYPNSAE